MSPQKNEEDDEETGSDFDVDNNPNIPEQGKRKLKRG
jgi:hypothetical protein